jgi:formylglycine-generating enzyme required for sulfatase activity
MDSSDLGLKTLRPHGSLLTAVLLALLAAPAGCDYFDNDKLTEERALCVFGTKCAPKEPPEDTYTPTDTPTPEDTYTPTDTPTPGDTVGGCQPACTGNKVCIEGGCQNIGLTWVPIPGGSFQMGCIPGDEYCGDDEKPQHPVTISAFKMLETEVTEAQYFAVTGENPSDDYNGGGGDDSPVENITWFDAKAFCEAIGGRLPTEAEWEYAARAEGTTKYICGPESSCLDDYAWYSTNSDDGSGEHKHDVKGKLANDFGLYDMSGNVWEWVADWYDPDYYDMPDANNPQGPNIGSYRVNRGGGFVYDGVYDLRVSYRSGGAPSDVYDYVGFRCARSE